MTKTLKDKLNALPEKRRSKILLRANGLIQEELNVFGLLKGKFVVTIHHFYEHGQKAA